MRSLTGIMEHQVGQHTEALLLSSRSRWQRRGSSREKPSHTSTNYEHITDEHHREYLSETFGVGAPGITHGDPHGAYMYLMHECDIRPNRDGEEEQDLEWIQFSIPKDVGKSENTVKDAECGQATTLPEQHSYRHKEEAP